MTHPNSCMSVKTKGDVTGNDGGSEGDKQNKNTAKNTMSSAKSSEGDLQEKVATRLRFVYF